MTGAELHRSELSAVTASSYLIQTMSTQTARLKIQLLTLSASTVSHTAVTAFYPTIILMMQTVILPRLSKTVGKLTNKYVYDSLNELKEEYDYVNKFYINYSYDGAGNLQNKYEQALDLNYGYPTGTQNGNTYEYTDTSWKDKVTKVNGSNISYDANGNPLTYRDGMSFEWENGRILKKISTSDKSVQMSYDSNGMRTQKSVDGVKTNYYYDSNKNLIALVKGNDTLLFYYDSDGSATSFSFNGTMYFYVKNLQGDVIRIIDLAGTEVASYVYDSWGNIKDTKGDTTVRELNPIRYRDYVYDTETDLYY